MSYTIIGRSSPKCDYCDKAKALLDEHGIQYTFIDLSGRHTAVQVFNAFGFDTVPLIIDNNGIIIGGYNALDEYFRTNLVSA